MRDAALEETYGKGFVDQYAKNKLVGQGAIGSVFEMPNDPSQVRKVQRTTEDVLRSPSIGIQRREMADDEVEAQLKAMEAGVAPRLHAVETYPVAKRKYHLGYDNESKQDEVMHIICLLYTSDAADE